MEKIFSNSAVEAVKSEKDEKKILPWLSNHPITFENVGNYSYNPPFPSPLPSPLDQSQSSLFNTFEGDHSFPAQSALWYSGMLEGGDVKPYYMMRQNQQEDHSNQNGLQSPPVTPYLNENLQDLGSVHQQQLRAMMQLRALGYGLIRPKMMMEKGDVSLPIKNINVKSLEKEKPFKCTYPGCEARFPRMYNLKSHMLCHTGERPHVCPLECGAKFARKHDLQRHMRTLHSPNRPFQCPFEKCLQAFRRANSFWRHLVEDHPDKSPEHAEIYQRAVQQQKENQGDKNPPKPPMTAIPAPIEIPFSASSLHNVDNMSGQHTDPFFSSVPRLNDSMIYRGNFN